MIRILYCIATLDPHGAERQLCLLASGLDRRRFEPAVCCLTRGGPLEQPLRSAGIEVFHLRKSWKLDMSVLGSLAKLLRRRRFDIIHTWLFTSNAFGRTAACLARTPVIVASERCVDLWKNSIYFFADKCLNRVTDAVICNSAQVADFVRGHTGISPDRLHVIPNGLYVEQIKAERSRNRVRAELGVPARSVLLCSAGRLAPQKSFDRLIDSVACMKAKGTDVHAVILGDGGLRESLERRVRACGLEGRVRLPGYRRDIYDIMAASDVFVLTSEYEGMPNVLMEAMALGVPVVATRVAGVDELIQDGYSGRVVNAPFTAARIADAVLAVIQAPGRGCEMAGNARDIILSRFTVDKMVQRYEKLYESLCRHEQQR